MSGELRSGPCIPLSFSLLFLNSSSKPFFGGEFDGLNVVMAWQGHRDESTLYKISSTGSATQTTLRNVGVRVTDEGYYGAGINFTQWPRCVCASFSLFLFRCSLSVSLLSYGAMYAQNNNKLLLSYVCVGRVYPVTEWPLKYLSPIRGKNKPMKGFDSHFVIVHKIGQGGYPCLPGMAIEGDELVVFRPEQVCSNRA